MVRPSRRGRMRALLTSEESTGVVDGSNVDWDEGGIFDPVTGALDQWKQPVRVASTATVTISTGLNAGDTIDGVTLAAGDRVLLKDQSTASQNGIYVAGVTPARAADFDDDAEVLGAIVYVIAGTTNTATAWKVTNTAAVTVGSTSIVWAAFGTGGSASFATPAIVLSTTAAAGAASTVIRSDATIAAFDATVPVTQAFSDTAATGSAAFAARRDHKHGMPASPGGSSQAFNEIDAAVLVNATSTGDAGSRADHFTGTTLDVAWVGEATALNAGPTVKYSAVGMRHTTNNAHHRLRAYTPSGAFRVETRVRHLYTTSAAGVGLMVRDSSTGDSTGNFVLAWIGATGQFEAYTLDTGVLTQRGATLREDSRITNGYVFLAIERDGSNNWKCEVSIDRALWIAGVTGHSKTFTVAKVGYRLFGNSVTAAVDFFDVVS